MSSQLLLPCGHFIILVKLKNIKSKLKKKFLLYYLCLFLCVCLCCVCMCVEIHGNPKLNYFRSCWRWNQPPLTLGGLSHAGTFAVCFLMNGCSPRQWKLSSIMLHMQGRAPINAFGNRIRRTWRVLRTWALWDGNKF